MNISVGYVLGVLLYVIVCYKLGVFAASREQEGLRKFVGFLFIAPVLGSFLTEIRLGTLNFTTGFLKVVLGCLLLFVWYFFFYNKHIEDNKESRLDDFLSYRTKFNIVNNSHARIVSDFLKDVEEKEKIKNNKRYVIKVDAEAVVLVLSPTEQGAKEAVMKGIKDGSVNLKIAATIREV